MSIGTGDGILGDVAVFVPDDLVPEYVNPSILLKLLSEFLLIPPMVIATIGSFNV
jgi:hypothetical protein